MTTNWLSPNPMKNLRRKHKHVGFHVDDASGRERVFDTFDEAAGFAVALSAGSGWKQNIDVVIWSEAGARWYAGEDGVEHYREDPDASVFERIEVKAHDVGRVP